MSGQSTDKLCRNLPDTFLESVFSRVSLALSCLCLVTKWNELGITLVNYKYMDKYKSMGTDKIHPKVPRSWLMSTQSYLLPTSEGYSSQGVPYNTIIFKMGKKDLRNGRLISSSSGPRVLWGESTEKLIFRHTNVSKKVTKNSQHKLTRRKSC